MKTKHRIISLVMAVILAVTAIPIGTLVKAYAENPLNVKLMYEGNEVNDIIVPENEKLDISAECDEVSNLSYQWQIKSEKTENSWIDISDATEKTLPVSYALVSSVLDSTFKAQLRCVVNSDIYESDSNALTVKVSFTAESAVVTNANASDYAMNSGTIGSISANEFGEGGEPENEYVNITVNYKDAVTGSPIFSSFKARLKSGSNFSQIVVSPSFIGYTPMWNGVDGTAAKDSAVRIPLDFVNLTHDVNIDVNYEAIDVDYAVRYYFQNINDDFYTENTNLYYKQQAKTGTIIQNSEILTHAGNIEGFEKLFHIPESVAADGSTVFECYFDRNYYLLNFDMAGGYGTEPVFGRYGAIFAINNPTRHGYIFQGWDELTEDTDGDGVKDKGDGIVEADFPTSIPAENRSYRAIWKDTETTVTYVYWKENANDDGYSYWGSSHETARSGSYVSASDNITSDVYIKDEGGKQLNERPYFTYNEARSDKNVLVEGDGSTVVNVYYLRNRYTVDFVDTGACKLEEHTHNDSCYSYICGKDGVEHTHTNACLSCTLTEHKHSSACCSLEEHTHSRTCYSGTSANSTANPWGAPSNPQNGQVFRRTNTSQRYIYYNGRWYNYSQNVASGTIVDMDCGKEEHTHGTGCNTDNCAVGYEHVHDDINCYQNCPYPGVHHHSDACKMLTCTKREHTHSTNCNRTNRTNLVYSVTAKYDSNMVDVWENTIIKTDYTDKAYVFESSVNRDKFYSFLEKIPSYNLTLTATLWSGQNFEWYYYLEAYENQDLTGLTTRQEGGKTYYLYHTTKIKASSGTELTYDEDYFDISGYVQRDSAVPVFNNGKAYLYYNRAMSTLSYSNYGTNAKNETKYYMDDISGSEYNFVPGYPNALEPNAYEFDGWYTSPELVDGSEFDFTNAKMPAENVGLYAKWTPKTHTVRFFQTLNDLQNYEKNGDTSGLIETHEVLHGNYLGAVENPVDKSGFAYSFGGWFTIENGSKKAFTVLDTPVVSDYNIFADWGSHTAQPYLIHYTKRYAETDNTWISALNEDAANHPVNNVTYEATVDGETRYYVYSDGGYHQCVAKDTTGYGYQGVTRTFVAKANHPQNNQLLPQFSKGYYPLLASHSITIAFENVGVTYPENNIFTFNYVQVDNVNYKVRYVDKTTGEEISAPVNKVTDESVVTERFKPITGYVADSFYKQLVLAVKEDSPGHYTGADTNVITFYYTKNESSAIYAVHNMLQKIGTTGTNKAIDGTGDYVEDSTIYQGIGDLNTSFSYNSMEYTGFSAQSQGVLIQGSGATPVNRVGTANDDNGYTFNIQLQYDGTELYVFYTRNKYDFTVKYLNYNTNDSVLPDKVYNAANNNQLEYGSVLTETAPNAPGMKLVSERNKTVTVMTLPRLNQIIFYYTPIQYKVVYETVGGDATCSVTPTVEIRDGQEEFSGSTASVDTGSSYEFIGWFMDKECTIPAQHSNDNLKGGANVTGDKVVPVNEWLDGEADQTTFYAKFKLKTGSLTINRSDVSDESNGTQTFVYKITSDKDPNQVCYATITGNGSVTVTDLPVGGYTVEQMNDWSWRYNDASKICTVVKDDTVHVTFSKGSVISKWLNGFSNAVKNVRG